MSGITASHFLKVIRDTLAAMGPPYNSEAAAQLLALTAAQESQLGRWLWQAKRDGSPGGPAVGPYQMEPGRWSDTVARWSLALARKVWDVGHCDGSQGSDWMAWNLHYATAMARAAYWLIPEALPAADDLDGLASYWHRHWCRGCRGTPEQAIRAYRRLVAGKEG